MNIISKKIHEIKLNSQQKAINKEYQENGLTEEVLEKQIALNQKRHELDIPDSQNKIFENFVQ